MLSLQQCWSGIKYQPQAGADIPACRNPHCNRAFYYYFEWLEFNDITLNLAPMARTTHRLLLSVTSNSWSLGLSVDRCIHQVTEQIHSLLIIVLFVLMFTVNSASLSNLLRTCL